MIWVENWHLLVHDPFYAYLYEVDVILGMIILIVIASFVVVILFYSSSYHSFFHSFLLFRLICSFLLLVHILLHSSVVVQFDIDVFIHWCFILINYFFILYTKKELLEKEDRFWRTAFSQLSCQPCVRQKGYDITAVLAAYIAE